MHVGLRDIYAEVAGSYFHDLALFEVSSWGFGKTSYMVIFLVSRYGIYNSIFCMKNRIMSFFFNSLY